MDPVSLLLEEAIQVLFNSKGPGGKSFDEVVSLRVTANNELNVSIEEVSLLTKREGLSQSLHKTCLQAPWHKTKLVFLAMILGPRHRNHHSVHFITHQSFVV